MSILENDKLIQEKMKINQHIGICNLQQVPLKIKSKFYCSEKEKNLNRMYTFQIMYA